MLFVYGLILGVFVGGTLSYLYAQKVINKAKAAANTASSAVNKL